MLKIDDFALLIMLNLRASIRLWSFYVFTISFVYQCITCLCMLMWKTGTASFKAQVLS